MVSNTQAMVANSIIIIKPQGQALTGTTQIHHLAHSSDELFPPRVAHHGSAFNPIPGIILSMAGSGCERLFINSVNDIQMGVTQNKLNDEIWV